MRWLVSLVLCTYPACFAATWYVGGDAPENYGVDAAHLKPNPCAAFAEAADGDTVRIDARYGYVKGVPGTNPSGIYLNDVCGISKNGLTIQGINGRPRITVTNGTLYTSKAIWSVEPPPLYPTDPNVTTTIENVEMYGAVPKPGSGITSATPVRLSGGSLILRSVYFHHSQMGFLTDYLPYNDLLIENSQFELTTTGQTQSHNIYVDKMRFVTFRYNYSNCAKIGHTFKSRAWMNFIYANRFSGEYCSNSYSPQDRATTTSYEVDLSLGGTGYIVGNVFQQGPSVPSPQNVTPPQPGAPGGNGSMVAFERECTDNEVNYKAHWKRRTVLSSAITPDATALSFKSTAQLPPSGTGTLLTETYLRVGIPGLPAVRDRVRVMDASDFPQSGQFSIEIQRETTLLIDHVEGNELVLASPYSGPSYYAGAIVSLRTGDEEQIHWDGNTGNQLTGVTRGINGTTARTHRSDQYLQLDQWDDDIHFVNNTMVSDSSWPIAKFGYVYMGMTPNPNAECGVNPDAVVRMLNNAFYGPSTMSPFRLLSNYSAPQPDPAVDSADAHNWNGMDFSNGPTTGGVAGWFYDPLLTRSDKNSRYSSGNYDYHLKDAAGQLIGRGGATLDAVGLPCGIGGSETCSEVQQNEYLHPVNSRPRANQNDIGAFAYDPSYSVAKRLSVLADNSVVGLNSGKVTVSLPGPQPSDTVVSFLSSDETLLSKPSSIVIRAGETSVSGIFDTSCAANTATATILASAVIGGAPVTGSSDPISITAAPFKLISLDRNTASGPHFSVTNCGPAPAGGATLTVTSSDPTAIWAAPTVTIPEGALYVSLGTMTGSNFGPENKSFTLTVSYTPPGGGDTQTLSYSGTAAPVQVASWFPKNGVKQVSCGTSVTFTATTTQPAARGGSTVSVTSDNPSVLPDQTFIIPEDTDNSGVYPQIQTRCGSGDTPLLVSATLNGSKKPAVNTAISVLSQSNLLVLGGNSSAGPALSDWYAIPGPQPVVACGNSFYAYAALSDAATGSGAEIPITSSNAAVIPDTSAIIAAGALTPAGDNITISTACGQGTLNVVTLTAAYGGTQKTFTAVVVDTPSLP